MRRVPGPWHISLQIYSYKNVQFLIFFHCIPSVQDKQLCRISQPQVFYRVPRLGRRLLFLHCGQFGTLLCGLLVGKFCVLYSRQSAYCISQGSFLTSISAVVKSKSLSYTYFLSLTARIRLDSWVMQMHK